jgi:hypothetical protein
MKEMLDIVQNDVLKKLLPSVQFLRLDGSVEATKRQNIVNQFNTDPSYDVLLLTTSVGGLGLNLTGADTVIFVEHDWNPQKDIQAMDRAHRIGQKKVVNVYRLITRGTLEEKILKYVYAQNYTFLFESSLKSSYSLHAHLASNALKSTLLQPWSTSKTQVSARWTQTNFSTFLIWVKQAKVQKNQTKTVALAETRSIWLTSTGKSRKKARRAG